LRAASARAGSRRPWAEASVRISRQLRANVIHLPPTSSRIAVRRPECSCRISFSSCPPCRRRAAGLLLEATKLAREADGLEL
jgi:hypothetical protein